MRSKSYREYALFQGTGSFLNVFYIKPQIKSQVSKHRNKINTEKKGQQLSQFTTKKHLENTVGKDPNHENSLQI